ncbi:sensor histidine kinase [Chitinophaga lutea]
MRNRIRAILFLMCACILGIFIFQGYWLYQAYRVKVQDFSRDANISLWAAADRPGVFAMRDSLIAPPGARPRVMVFTSTVDRLRPDSLGHIRISRTVNARTMGRSSGSSQGKIRVALDSLNSFFHRMPEPVDEPAYIRSVDSAFRAELHKRSIYTPYQIGITGPDGAPKEAGGLRTVPVPVNPMADRYLQARFSSPMPQILKGMLGSLAGSAALLLLTTGCFVFMLRTILRQKRLSEVKNDFINNMTHELKTPIATVSAAVEAMQHFNALSDPHKTETYLRISRQELQRLSDLVEKVLHIAAEEKEDFALHYEPTDVNDMIADIVANHRLHASKELDFRYNLLSTPLVQADKTHLSNAINNLVDNAVKYSGDPAIIAIDTARRDNRLHITVRDNGRGIPPHYHDSIFEKFFRVPTGNLHNVKGFGLGLSYVKKVVEMHGGSVSVKSVPDKGSEFILEIPLKPTA